MSRPELRYQQLDRHEFVKSPTMQQLEGGRNSLGVEVVAIFQKRLFPSEKRLW